MIFTSKTILVILSSNYVEYFAVFNKYQQHQKVLQCNPHFQSTAIKTLSHVDYKLAGDREAFLVKAAYLTNHFSLRPFENVESAYTSTR